MSGSRQPFFIPPSGLAFGKIVSRDWAIDVARGYNDWLYHEYMKKSPRFKGIALIPLQEPQAAVEELRRAVKELGMCGAMLPSTGIQANLGDQRYWPIYEEAESIGLRPRGSWRGARKHGFG